MYLKYPLIIFNFIPMIWTSLVLNLPQFKPVVLLLDQQKPVTISEIQSFCFKFNWTGPFKDTLVFADGIELNDFGLRLFLDAGNGFVTIGSEWLIFSRRQESIIIPYAWHHFCFSMNSTAYQIVCQGQTWYSREKRPSSVEKLSKTLKEIVIGAPHTGKLSPWVGQLTELNIWSRSLSEPEMIEITGNCGLNIASFQPDLLNWSSLTNLLIKGQAHEEPNENLCFKSIKKMTRLVPQPYELKVAKHICDIMAGKVANAKALKFPVLNMPSTCPPYLIAPFSRIDNGSWIDVYNGQVKDLSNNWDKYQPDGFDIEQCAMYETTKGLLHDVACNDKFCFTCYWEHNPIFKLRGLCKEAQIDRDYVLLPEMTFNGQVVFAGFRKNMIVYSLKKKIWMIIEGTDINVNEDEIKIVGYSTPKSDGLPIGALNWNLQECTEEFSGLKFSMCGNDRFTCDDGSCIDLDHRCDNKADCADESDEESCEPLDVNEKTYRKILPPPTCGCPGKKGKTEISVSIHIKSLDNIAEQAMTFDAKLSVRLWWHDPRITYKNLNKNAGNFISKHWQEQIWLPLLTFSNNALNWPLTKDDSKTVKVLEQSPGFYRDDSYKNQALLHKGSENELALYGQYDLTFDCVFDLTRYPFDEQECSIDIAIPEDLQNLTYLTGKSIKYSGTDQLLQFSVTKPTFLVSDTKLKGIIKLKRIPAFMIINCYLASFLIILMTLATLFLKNEMHFSTTVALVLTSQLCLFTLFQTILNDVPKTAYLKLIDYWCIFGFSIPFFIFFNLIISEMVGNCLTGGRKRMYFKSISRFIIPIFGLIGLTSYVFAVYDVFEFFFNLFE